MCDTIMTHDGYVIESIGEMRQYGIKLPDSVRDNDCLCGVPSLKDVLAADKREWKWTQFCPEWSEVGEDGKTWNEGFLEDAERSSKYIIYMYRPDGREPRETLSGE